MPDFMFDTNAFNCALDLSIDLKDLEKRGRLFTTHIQPRELKATLRDERREALMAAFQSVDLVRVPTATAVWDVSEWGEAEWGDGDGLYGQMLGSLNCRNKGKESNAHDVLIALTALKRGQTLVTDDRDLEGVLREHGGCVTTFADFLQLPIADST
jgi:hypothetical protein